MTRRDYPTKLSILGIDAYNEAEQVAEFINYLKDQEIIIDYNQVAFHHYCSTESEQDPVLAQEGVREAKGEQHTRDQRLLTALIGFRSGDPIRGSINGVLSEKQVQLGRMFLHMAHVVQEEL